MAGIIKAGNWRESGDDVQSAAFNFEDMSHRADDYLATVRRQAAQIIAQAKQQAAQIGQAAMEQGQLAATAQAEEVLQVQLDQKLASLLPALHQAIESIRHSKQAWLKQWEQKTVQLAAAIARRVIRRELSESPEITLDLVREALQLALGSGQIRLHLHPKDYESLGQGIEQITASIGNLAPADIVPDPGISLGTCRVVTEFGVVDQTIDAQLERIEEELT